jgi:ABC-2 type transport system ATP-binding protein
MVKNNSSTTNIKKVKEVIKVVNLTKQYGTFQVVDHLNFSVNQGEVFGVLGENGAGKTTTLEMIEGLRKMTSGEIEILGNTHLDFRRIKENIGIQLQSTSYYNFLSLKEILSLFASFYKKSLSVEDLLKMVNLDDKSGSYLQNLSGGQQQRFSIAASLINDPEIVFLDEPTTGLDPLARRMIWDLINQIKAVGKTIILTTHYMEEAERLCDRIAIMEKGKILVLDSVAELLKLNKNPISLAFQVNKISNLVLKQLQAKFIVEKLVDGSYKLGLQNEKELREALRIILPLDLENLRVQQATLEDLFLALTGKKLEDN